MMTGIKTFIRQSETTLHVEGDSAQLVDRWCAASRTIRTRYLRVIGAHRNGLRGVARLQYRVVGNWPDDHREIHDRICRAGNISPADVRYVRHHVSQDAVSEQPRPLDAIVRAIDRRLARGAKDIYIEGSRTHPAYDVIEALDDYVYRRGGRLRPG